MFLFESIYSFYHRLVGCVKLCIFLIVKFRGVCSCMEIMYEYTYIHLQTLMVNYLEDDVPTPIDSSNQRAIRSGYTGPKNNRGKPDTTGTDEIGVMIYPPDDYYVRYSGQWKNGIFEGHGTIVFDNGDTYTGDFKNSKLHGYGVYTYLDGQVLNGKFIDDVIVSGEHTCSNYTFQGTFINGKIYEGKIIYSDRTKFEGIFQTPIQRFGKFSYTNGDVFSGTFNRDGVKWLLNGYGEMIVSSVPDKYTYRGQTRNGVRHGNGIMSINGKTYSARFEDNREIERSRDEMRGGKRNRSCVHDKKGE